MMYATLKRTYHPEVTTGILEIYYEKHNDWTTPILRLSTVELPWRGNQRNISCIPGGRMYLCTPRESDKHHFHFLVNDVPDRELILIHVANFTSDLQGCIGVGKSHADINQDSIMDVVYSRDAMEELLRHGGYHRDGFLLDILNEPDNRPPHV